MAGGLTIVLVDFRAESLDLLPDPIGWLLVAAGAMAVALPLTAGLAGSAAMLSISDAFLPHRTVSIDPTTGEAIARCRSAAVCGEQIQFDPVSGLRLAALAASIVVGGLAVLTLLRGLRRRALRDADRFAAERLLLLVGGVGLGWVLPQMIAIVWAMASADGSYDPIWNGNAEYAALLGWAALGWVILELCLRSGAGWAIPAHRQVPSRWSRHRGG